MNVNHIKPSETKSWDIVKHESQSKLSMATKSLVHPDHYNFYQKDGKWYPIRKPTVSEILKDQYV
jgi:hypothetical protein